MASYSQRADLRLEGEKAIDVPSHWHVDHMNKTFRSVFPTLLAAVLASAVSLDAQGRALQIDPGRTTVEFTLGALLHSVHGTFRLASGRIGFDPATGRAGGELVVDATSGKSDNAARDKKMHGDILESARCPRMVFRPDRVEGAVAGQGVSKVQVYGSFEIHGDSHEMAVPVEVRASAGEYEVTAAFSVPYVKWGMKNPSTFILRVNDRVEITVHTVAKLQGAD
jgi:polyisoprenoid-binding protein YceI